MGAKTSRAPRPSTGGGPLLPEWIYERLENAIVDRVYPPGTHIKEDEIAAELGVSRTPVREAFRMLQRAGWLDFRARAGAYVRYPSIEDIRDVFELRQRLEEWGAQLAAERANDRHIRALRLTVGKGWSALERDNVKAMAELNSLFHQQLATATGNHRLEALLRDLAKLIQWHFAVVAQDIGEDSWREHSEIVDAVEAGDGRRASDVIARHISGTRTIFLQRYLPDQGSEPGRGSARETAGRRPLRHPPHGREPKRRPTGQRWPS